MMIRGEAGLSTCSTLWKTAEFQTLMMSRGCRFYHPAFGDPEAKAAGVEATVLEVKGTSRGPSTEPGTRAVPQGLGAQSI
jgi:hypothetical protein